MRSILFDELTNSEIEAVTEYLKRESTPSGLEGLYWLPLPRDLWNKTQLESLKADKETKGFKLAVEVSRGLVRFELLVRSESLINTGRQADERQVMFILLWADKMAKELNLQSCLSAGQP